MQDQDAYRRHQWHVEAKHRSPISDEYLESERCEKCKATRTILYPICMIVDSDPKPVPKYCPVHK